MIIIIGFLNWMSRKKQAGAEFVCNWNKSLRLKISVQPEFLLYSTLDKHFLGKHNQNGWQPLTEPC